MLSTRKQNDARNVNQQDIDRLAMLINDLYSSQELNKTIAQQAMRYHSRNVVKRERAPLQVYTDLLTMLVDHHLKTIGMMSRLNARSREVYDIVLTELERLSCFEDSVLPGPHIDKPTEAPSIAYQDHLGKQLLKLTYLAYPQKLEQELKFEEQRRIEQAARELKEQNRLAAEQERKNERAIKAAAYQAKMELLQARRDKGKDKEKFVPDTEEIEMRKVERERAKQQREEELKGLQQEREQARQFIIARKKEMTELKNSLFVTVDGLQMQADDLFVSEEVSAETVSEQANTQRTVGEDFIIVNKPEAAPDHKLLGPVAEMHTQLKAFLEAEMTFFPKGNHALSRLQDRLEANHDNEAELINIAKEANHAINGFKMGNPMALFSHAAREHKKESSEKINAIIEGRKPVRPFVALD